MIKMNKIKSSSLIKCPFPLSGWASDFANFPIIQCERSRELGGNNREQRGKLIKNKKAISSIIATLIIILVSLVAVSMLWITFNNFANEIKMSPEINCFDIKIQPPITINSVCYNSENKQIEVELKRNFNEIQINSLKLITETREWQCSSACGNCIILNSGETKKYFLDEQTQPKEITLQIEDCIIETKNVGSC